MLQINKQYRNKYISENIVVERNYNNGLWQDSVECIYNAVTNNQISNRAVVIGNGPSRLNFNLNQLKTYSGLLGASTLQTYGCNALYRDFTPDFLIAIGTSRIINEIATSDYITKNIVYSNAMNMLEYPRKFYLIPHDPYTDAGTTALYMAAFDGHKTIYMLGHDGQDTPGYNYNVYAGTDGYDKSNTTVLEQKWVQDKATIFNTYDDVDFVRVTHRGTDTIPEVWKYCANFRQISHREFTLEADL